MKRNVLLYLCILLMHTMYAQQQMQVKKNNYTSFSYSGKQISSELRTYTDPAFYTHPDFGLAPINTPDSSMELIQKRTLDSRYYIKTGSQGHDFFIQKSSGPINYYDMQGNLRAIDYYLHPSGTPDVFIADAQPLPTTIDFVNNYTGIRIKDLDFKYNHDLYVKYQSGNTYSTGQFFNTAQHTVGDDGAYISDIFTGIDAEIAFRKGAIKTNFIVQDKSVLDPHSDFLVIEEFIPLPSGFYFEQDTTGVLSGDGMWEGDVVLKNNFGLSMLRIQRPIVIDASNRRQHTAEDMDAIGYDIVPQDGGVLFRIKVRTSWLMDPARIFPVTIDPTLIGEATYTAGDIGFEFNPVCWNDADYCNYFLDIVVPGKTTLTAAYFDGTYYSQLFGCGGFDCWMSEAAFRILGPCDDSPGPSSFWTCLPPVGDSAGTCWGIDLDMFNTIACIPPQCDDYNFTFEMRTFHCSCSKPPCSITCHYMPTDSWVITIEGKTVEENPIESNLFPDFTTCAGDTIDLFAGGMWGVPPYQYEWLPGGTFTDTLFIAPTSDIVYTSIIHDLCDMKDTVEQLITVNPLPVVNAGPFEGCYTTTLFAPAGYTSYIWTDADSNVLATGTNQLFIDSAGSYFVTVTDGNGCTGTSSPITGIIHVAPEINAFPDTVFVSDGALALLSAEVITGGDVSFLWTPPDDLNCPSCPTTLAYAAGDENIYYVTGSEFGCISDPDSIIVIMSESALIIPNAFTPNADGLNDVFHILNPIFYPEFTFAIYNRWGQQVFFTNDVLQGWDGTYEDRDQEIGMYVWVVTYEKANEPGKQYALRGTVTLLR
ncbi:MAG: gliding motility-associated C-terminal domain-containing protein [Chitinophagales bacterium]